MKDDSEITEQLLKIMLKRKASASKTKKVSYEQSVPLTKSMLGGIVGNVLEWFDFAIFGFFNRLRKNH